MKKKLLFLTVKFDTGGTEKVTYDIITRLDPEKYDITLMSMYGGGYYWDHLPAHIHRKYFFPKFIRYVIRYVTTFPGKLVYRTFIREKYDVEIACGDDIPSRVINHSTNPNSQRIAWIHMDVQERGYQGYEIRTEAGRRNFYRNFHHIVNVSRECERKFREKFGDDLPTCVIYNPVPAEEIREKGNARPWIVLPKERFNIVCMGRFTPQKGFDRLLDALKVLKGKDISGFFATILGDGYERPMLEQRIREYGLQDVVSLPGYAENPYAILKQADLFTLPSRDESFSLAVAEAMVLGVPVMSTRCTGPVELLKDGEAGCLVENSTEGILSGLERILTDRECYQDLCSKAMANTDNFDIAAQIDCVESLLDA
jgi:glycosyltransferase involved in cell wall biosynthesis